MKKIALILIFLLALGGAGFWFQQATATTGPRYRTATVKRGEVRAIITATGTIEPEEVVDVGAQVAGKLKNLGIDPHDPSKAIDYGTMVEEHTILAQIDDAIYKTQVDQARAGLLRARAEMQQIKAKLHQAEGDWNRTQKLNKGGGSSEALYLAAEATYESAKANVALGEASIALAQSSLDQAEINLGYTTIRSPVQGVIIDRRVNVGQTVVASLNAPSLFLIAKNLKRMQVWASVNEADIGQVHPGQAVRFTVDAYPNELFRGEVGQIRLNATMTQNVVTYTVVVTTDNSNGRLLPYLTASLQFEIETHTDVLQVPSFALRWKPSQKAGAGATPDRESGGRSGSGSGEKPKGGPSGGRPSRGGKGTVWIKDGTAPKPVEVQIGLTDGLLTEISGEIAENAEVIIGEIRADSNESTSNPFTPKMFGGGSGGGGGARPQ